MAEANQTDGKKQGSKLVPVLLAANTALMLALLGVFFLKGAGAPAVPASAEAPADGKPAGEARAAQPGPTTKLADFVVHLRDADADRYARVAFEIEVASDADQAQLALFMPRVRDGFISYLSDRTLEEVRGSESIRRLKVALAERLGALAPGVAIRGLFVTDLVIQ